MGVPHEEIMGERMTNQIKDIFILTSSINYKKLPIDFEYSEITKLLTCYYIDKPYF